VIPISAQSLNTSTSTGHTENTHTSTHPTRPDPKSASGTRPHREDERVFLVVGHRHGAFHLKVPWSER
jgi:hypothetical protein